MVHQQQLWAVWTCSKTCCLCCLHATEYHWTPTFLVCLLRLQEGSVYDFTFDMASCGWQHWRASAGTAAISEDAVFNDIIVQTVDTLRYSSLLRLLVQSGKHVLLAGPTGGSHACTCTLHCDLARYSAISAMSRPVSHYLGCHDAKACSSAAVLQAG
jgi:hypothetical protein